jgi:hypothetical protein
VLLLLLLLFFFCNFIIVSLRSGSFSPTDD